VTVLYTTGNLFALRCTQVIDDMKFFQEITPGDDYPNHTYLLSDNKEFAHGYIRAGTKDLFTFKSKYRFGTKGRKFREVTGYSLPDIEEPTPEGQVWEIVGSRGDKYLVQKIDNMLQCSCSGFKFRGNCKHVKQVEEQA
jgi:hypothetical protein